MTEPATDERSVIFEDRLETRRVMTIIECAQVARVWAQDRDLPYDELTNVILSLLDKKL